MADSLPLKAGRPVRTRIWYVAYWGPQEGRGEGCTVPACFRTAGVGSLEEAMAVAVAGARALDAAAPWLAGARVSKVMLPTEAAATETDRWLFVSADGGTWRKV